MEINRDVYLERLIVRKHNGFIKVITGIRRCGKSYLLNTLFYNHLKSENIAEDHIIKFAFDTAQDLIKIGEDPIILDNEKEDRKVDPSKFLNWLMPQIKGDEIFEGRGDEIHVFPLSFSEYYAFKQGEKGDAYDDYSVYGGLPAVALMTTEEQKTNYLISQMKNVYLRDIILRYSVQDEAALGEVMDVIASGISTLTNPRKIASTMNSVHGTTTCDTTVDKYIGYAEEAFILNRVKRYNVKGRKYIGTPYKIYFEDIGLRNARLAFRQIEETHIMENIIYNELRFRGYQVDVGTVESREKDADGKDVRVQREIDFIATMGSKKYYIQSAYAIPNKEKYEQETMSFERTMDSFKKIIIVEKSMKPRYDENGYLMMGVKEFLLDANSLLV